MLLTFFIGFKCFFHLKYFLLEIMIYTVCLLTDFTTGVIDQNPRIFWISIFTKDELDDMDFCLWDYLKERVYPFDIHNNILVIRFLLNFAYVHNFIFCTAFFNNIYLIIDQTDNLSQHKMLFFYNCYDNFEF